MASLFLDDLNSSDSEDEDYVPNQQEELSSSDEEPMPPPDDEIKTKKKSKRNDPTVENEKNEVLDDPTSETEKNELDEKKRANDLFENFLKEVEAETKEKSFRTSSDSAFESPMSSSDTDVKSSGCGSNEVTPKKELCELFDFAGETVAVSLGNDGSSKITSSTDLDSNMSSEPVNPEISVADKPVVKPPVVKRKGLESVLGTILNKKPKLNTLEKTALDWKEFKAKEGISEELSNFNRGKGGFLERKRFLERSDIRSYEIERDMRLSKGKKNY